MQSSENPPKKARKEVAISPGLYDKLDAFLYEDLPQPATTGSYSTIRERILKLRERTVTRQHVLDYWRANCSSDPGLEKLAKIVLALPVTQVTVERAFSHLPLVITNRRNRLMAKTIKAIFMVKFNGCPKTIKN